MLKTYFCKKLVFKMFVSVFENVSFVKLHLWKFEWNLEINLNDAKLCSDQNFLAKTLLYFLVATADIYFNPDWTGELHDGCLRNRFLLVQAHRTTLGTSFFIGLCSSFPLHLQSSCSKCFFHAGSNCRYWQQRVHQRIKRMPTTLRYSAMRHSGTYIYNATAFCIWSFK